MRERNYNRVEAHGAERLLLYPESILEGDTGQLVWEKNAVLKAHQMPCRGCGEHFYLTEEEIHEAVQARRTPLSASGRTAEEFVTALLRDMALFCFRCKARRMAEAATARGEIQ